MVSISTTENRHFKKFLNPFQKKSSLENLKALRFEDCGRLKLRDHAFSPAQCLLILDLSGCFIKKLPDSIGQLKKLRYLHAPQIKNRTFPKCITKLVELNYLNLSGSCFISALPESIGNMKGLIHLDLSGCEGIDELPVSFGDPKQLVHLNLSHCRMSISETFGGFTKLQYLNLSTEAKIGMNRRGLSKVVGNLIKLRYLNLSGSFPKDLSQDELNSLFGSISTLSKLEQLDLSSNYDISSIPESMCNLWKLHTLDLSSCYKLKKLPDSMVNMVSLKVLNVDSQVTLDESVLSLLNIVSLPHFVVHASSDKCSSNIILLQPTNPVVLTIDRLENVKSAKEAQSIAVGMFVDDEELLEKLVPPSSVQKLSITGYMSASFPAWLMSINQYLTNLLELCLCDFPNCTSLPPLGQLPNLVWMSLCRMECLEEWNTSYTSGEEGANELMFPQFRTLSIKQCAKLRIKPCISRGNSLRIEDCDNLLSSWGESSSHTGASSSSPITNLIVMGSKVPLHQWRVLHQLPALRSLSIRYCSDLTASPEIIQQVSSLKLLTLQHHNQAELPRWVVELASLQVLKLLDCKSMTSLPQWLGELTSLKELEIKHCKGINSLPGSIQKLTKLEHLNIHSCPMLREWCESEENKMKLAHIKEVLYPAADAHEERMTESILKIKTRNRARNSAWKASLLAIFLGLLIGMSLLYFLAKLIK